MAILGVHCALATLLPLCLFAFANDASNEIFFPSFVLSFRTGYDRSIPGYKRYSVVGSMSDGVHNLRIEDAKIDDDGDYECQVGPGVNSKPIVAKTKVTVLIRPSSITLVGTNLAGQGTATAVVSTIATSTKSLSTFEVMSNQSRKLECVVSGGRPAASIKWYRSLSIHSSHREEVTANATTTTKTYSAESSDLTAGSPGELSSTSSTINLSPLPSDNGAVYTCECSHAALSTPMSSSTVLSVLFAPTSQPEISGYIEGSKVKAGDHLKLTCRIRGGNPLASLTWYKNNEVIDSSYTTHDGIFSINEYTFTVEPSDNAAVYRCEASSPLISPASPLRSSVKFSVYFAPSKVTIKGPKEAKAGDSLFLTCKTGKSNPPAEVSWVIDGREVASKYTVISDPTGGAVTSTNITINITDTDRSSKSIACYANNRELSESVVESYALSVLYPPEPPTILGYREGSNLRAGDILRLTCVSAGGNPPPTLKWYVNEEEIKTGITGPSVASGGNSLASTGGSGGGGSTTASNQLLPVTSSTQSQLTINLKDSDNGATYSCSAGNSASPEPMVTSVTLSVYFAPSGVAIKVKPKKPRTGSKVELICESGGSNPPPEITWWKSGSILQGCPDGTFNTSYGGKAARNILLISNVTSLDDSSVYTCQASNKQLDVSVHDAITLDVSYVPEFLITSDSFQVTEGSSLTINLTARGNPSDISYKWLKKEPTKGTPAAPNGPFGSSLVPTTASYSSPTSSSSSSSSLTPSSPSPASAIFTYREVDFDSERVSIKSAILSIANVRRSDAGTYRVQATNEEGSAFKEITIDVKCKFTLTFHVSI